MKCPDCGREIADNSNYCDYCGIKIKLKPKQNKKYFWIALGVLLSVALIGAITIVFQNKSEKEDTITESQEEDYRMTDLDMQELKGKVKAVTTKKYNARDLDGEFIMDSVPASTDYMEFTPLGRFIYSRDMDNTGVVWENKCRFSGDTIWNTSYQEGEIIWVYEFVLTEWGAIRTKIGRIANEKYQPCETKQENIFNKKRQKIKQLMYENGELDKIYTDFEYDDKNRITHQVEYSKDDEKIREWTIVYNKDGFRESEICKDFVRQNEWSYIYNYKLDKQGNYIYKKTSYGNYPGYYIVEERTIEYYD